MTDPPGEHEPGPTPSRRRPRWFVPTAAAAVALLVVGVVVTVLGYRDAVGPDGAVRDYFAALQRGNAADALARGGVPDEPRVLLTDEVLAEQRRVAPITDVTVTGVRRAGGRARVAVRYTLSFPGVEQPVDTSVPVREVDGDWRLVRAAIPTQLRLVQAADRATVLAHRVPTGTVLMFPGAVPIAFDTAYLQLVPDRANVSFDSGTPTPVIVEPSATGRRAAVTATATALRRCLSGTAAPTCPQPTERYVPGSVRGRVDGRLASALTVQVGDGASGTLEITGTVPVRGSYRLLGFDNRLVVRRGEFQLPVRSRGYAVAPLRTTWMRST